MSRAWALAATVVALVAMARPASAEGSLKGLFAPNAIVGSAPVTFDASAAPLALPSAEALAVPDQQPPHPAPRHTGFQALVRTTGADFAAFPRRPSTWVILAGGAVAAAAAYPADKYVTRHLTGSPAVRHFFGTGKWIGASYVQAGVAVGLYVAGRLTPPKTKGAPRTNKVSHLGFDLVRANIMSQALTHGIKYAVGRDRPTGECCSFPSGHAATTFATAAVLERHLGYRGAWPTLLIATYVGMSRIQDNRHYLSDVLFGAALGTATGWTIVGRHGRSDYTLVPMPVRGGMAVAFVRVTNTKNGT